MASSRLVGDAYCTGFHRLRGNDRGRTRVPLMQPMSKIILRLHGEKRFRACFISQRAQEPRNSSQCMGKPPNFYIRLARVGPMGNTQRSNGIRRSSLLLVRILILGLLLACGEAEPTGPELDPFGNGPKLYSQENEELIIRDFFNDRRDGFFLDVGCYDYKDISTTYYLEKHLGWSGIGVDANEALREDYELHRPQTKFENYVVTNRSGGTQTFYLVVGGEGISSVSLRWVIDFLNSFFPEADPTIRKVQIPAITLNDLLDQNGVTEIDFLSMDIEGHEPAALAGFDIERFAPELVCIEAPSNPEPILNYFEEHGYQRIERYLEFDRVNWYFQPAASKGAGGPLDG